MEITSGGAIFVAVVAARVLVPLAIPRYPLPAMLAALVIDGLDQTIFQTFTTLDLSGYQQYDKALDVYYLSIAYVATMRNWTNFDAFGISRFLYYYRLIGVVAFELTQIRALLLVFPNTFEYFFDAYEAVRIRWDPRRMSWRLLIGIAAFIWIFIKLPQEWWIHVAQLDATDLIKEKIFGVPTTASWAEAFAEQPARARRRRRRAGRRRGRGLVGHHPRPAARGPRADVQRRRQPAEGRQRQDRPRPQAPGREHRRPRAAREDHPRLARRRDLRPDAAGGRGEPASPSPSASRSSSS